MNVLSVFDGISAGQIALARAGIKVDNYFASEIDPYAIQITQKNYPNTVQLGDCTQWRTWNLPKIDLVIGGSPCTQLSVAGNGEGLDGKDSSLFYVYLDILNYWKWMNQDVKFLLENVKMKAEWRLIMDLAMDCDSQLINSALVSAQNRERYYWTNIVYQLPEDKYIYLKDIVFDDVVPVVMSNVYGGFKEKSVRVHVDKSPTIRTAKGGGHIPSLVLKELIHSDKALEYMNRQVKGGRTHWDFGHHSDIDNPKSAAVVANFFKGVPYNVFKSWNVIRKFHPIECERLQTMPDDYTAGISPTQRYKCIGNSWTVDVVASIFGGLR